VGGLIVASGARSRRSQSGQRGLGNNIEIELPISAAASSRLKKDGAGEVQGFAGILESVKVNVGDQGAEEKEIFKKIVCQ